MTPFLDALWEILNPSLDTVSVTLLIYNKNKVRNTGLFCPAVHGYSLSEQGKSWQQEREAAVAHILSQEAGMDRH